MGCVALGTALLAAGLSVEGRSIPSSPAVQKSAAAQSSAERVSSITIASLNLARKHRLDQVRDEIQTLIERRRIDILLLQEVEKPSGDPQVIAAELGRALQLHWLFAPAVIWKGGGVHGLATLSRYPLENAEIIPLRQFDLRFRNRNRIGLGATALTPLGPVRTFNVHFDSRINTSERLEQLSDVLDATANFTAFCVIGGDFNTADFRWFRRWLPIPYAARQKDAVRGTLAAWGFETPFRSTGATFKHFGLKLDWIFLRDLRPMEWGIETITFSDHRAIWIRMS